MSLRDFSEIEPIGDDEMDEMQRALRAEVLERVQLMDEQLQPMQRENLHDSAATLRDALANLEHWAISRGLDFSAAMRTARSHVALERDEAGMESAAHACERCGR